MVIVKQIELRTFYDIFVVLHYVLILSLSKNDIMVCSEILFGEDSCRIETNQLAGLYVMRFFAER